jgi:chromosome segregation ATPase
MTSRQIKRKPSPEEEELIRKREELAALEEELAQAELELHSLIGDAESFFATLDAAVGEKLAEREILKSRLAAALLSLRPDDPAAQERASQAEDEAREARREQEAASGSTDGDTSREGFASAFRSRLSEELRDLFRKLVKMAHPDLTTDPEEKERRTEFMKEVNAAYEAGDFDRLNKLLSEWQESPDSVEGEGVGAELVRVIRKIAQVTQRLEAVRAELSDLETSDDYAMFFDARERGFEEYIDDMMSVIDTDIRELNSGIDEVAARLTDLLDSSSLEDNADSAEQH